MAEWLSRRCCVHWALAEAAAEERMNEEEMQLSNVRFGCLKSLPRITRITRITRKHADGNGCTRQ